jgi:predicted amidohydrolase
MVAENNSPGEVLLGLVQMSMDEDPRKNLESAVFGIREAAGRGADIICLPELFRTPYFCTEEESEVDFSEEVPGVTGDTLSALSKELGVVIVGGSVYEGTTEGNFNTSMVFDSDGTLCGTYRKTHIPHDPAFYEQNYFTASESNYQVFPVRVKGEEIRIGVLICYDQWFPEAARSLALLGADIIFYPTAIGTVEGVVQEEGSWHEAWRTVQRGHAIANATVVAAVNRVGREGNSVFWGGSFVSDAFGRVLAEGTNREEIILAPVSLAHSTLVREGWRFFKERRPDSYSLLCEPVSKFTMRGE